MSFGHACPCYAFSLADRFTLPVLKQAVGTVSLIFPVLPADFGEGMLSPLRLVGNGHGCSERACASANEGSSSDALAAAALASGRTSIRGMPSPAGVS
jgi:hypothetical protein